MGEGLRVRGRVRGEGDLRIGATIEGDVVVTGALELEAAGAVNGAVEAESMVVSGTLEGDVSTKGAVAITAGGSVRGNISASEISLEEGGTFVGRVDADFELPEAIA